jgi:hypothetical protein
MPFAVRLAFRDRRWIANVTAFTALSAIFLAAIASISRDG